MGTAEAPLHRGSGARGGAGLIGVLSSHHHYLDHILPVVENCMIPWRLISRGEQRDVDLVVVASGSDAQQLASDVPYVYVEHGSGQSYEPWQHPAYSGGTGHASCVGFVCPSQAVAGRWRQRYSTARVAAIGCPKLDPWHRGERPIPTDMTVAITFHWNCNVSKFSRWAFPHYRRSLAGIVDAWRHQGWLVIGHGHPKAAGELAGFWSSIGVEWVPSYADVFDRANILVADNTSLIPEFMSLGRPVIFMNAPWYNTGKSVGGRFWDWDGSGRAVWSPEELAVVDLNDIALGDLYRDRREEVVRDVYAHVDGRTAVRAGAFLQSVYEGI